MMYKLKFYNSGGYKASDVISTDYLIQTDADGKRQVIDNGEVIGGDKLIEQLLNESQGWIESYCIYHVELVEPKTD